jgi:hypothetical protein
VSGKKLFAVAIIFVLATAAWFVLGGSVQIRTDDLSGRLGDEVSGLWGSQQTQVAPSFVSTGKGAGDPVELSGTDITADLALDQRRKGLMWYSTYVVDFDARYRVTNPAETSQTVTMTFTFPTPDGVYDGYAVKVNGSEAKVAYVNGSAKTMFPLAAGESATIELGYRANGMDSWIYEPSPDGVGVVRDFSLEAVTDFSAIDYPSNGASPTSRTKTDEGWRLEWVYDSVVSGRCVGVVMPTPINPGPLVSRITFFAPVSLLFFFAALVLLTATSGVRLHPVHYGFLAAAFFAFDLLLAYLADRLDINIAFGVAALTSVLLVLGYLRVVVGPSRALFEIAVSQLVFLVLFAYSFFFEGYTGLAITLGSVLTLAYFMAKTARVDWETVFAPKGPGAPAPVPTPQATPPVKPPAE